MIPILPPDAFVYKDQGKEALGFHLGEDEPKSLNGLQHTTKAGIGDRDWEGISPLTPVEICEEAQKEFPD